MFNEHKFYSQGLKRRYHVGELSLKVSHDTKMDTKGTGCGELNCLYLAQLTFNDALL